MPANGLFILFSYFLYMVQNKKLIAIIVLTILGMINAFYLSYEAYQALNPSALNFIGGSFCDINKQFSCTGFLATPDSRVFGIPFPWIAALVYPILFVLSVAAYFHNSRNLVRIVTILAFCGLAFNGYVISREFKVGVFCPLCLMCTGYILTIGILGLLILKDSKNSEKLPKVSDNSNY